MSRALLSLPPNWRGWAAAQDYLAFCDGGRRAALTGGMFQALTRTLLGRPVANREAAARKLGVFSGLPAMGLDGLGSASYGPEAALAVLAGTGAAGLAAIGPLIWVILGLLAILWFSYWQTIGAYPNNGGSYVVARENLGAKAGLLAAAALMVDYLLNVAVGISAGIGALASALPQAQPYAPWLCLGVLAILTVMNLRGTRDSAIAWGIPTYVFILGLGFVVAWGVVRSVAAGGHPQPVVAPPALPAAGATVTVWLLLRAFAAGCTAMTGVEAVSNGVSAFRDPPVRHARLTLSAIVVILGLLLLGIAHLARAYGIAAMDQSRDGYQSVLSQLVGAVYGRGWLYDVTIGSVLAVLCLSANTSFVDFPRLCRLVAQDGFLPAAFALPGRRLVYSSGIVFLAVGAGGLLVAFGGITDRLIPLFAIGAFLSFTMSQAGMAAHWWHARRAAGAHSSAGILARLAINAGGALASGTALVIILVAKFTEGAWLTVLVIPATLLLLRAIRRGVDRVDRQLLANQRPRLDLRDHAPPLALVPITRWDRLARNAVAYAIRLTPDVTAIHVTTLEGPDADRAAAGLRQDWAALVGGPAEESGLPAPVLRLVSSPFRSLAAPILKAIQSVHHTQPGRAILVVLPEFLETRWWGRILHTHRERRLRALLLRYGGPGIAVLSVPWQPDEAGPAQGVAAEET